MDFNFQLKFLKRLRDGLQLSIEAFKEVEGWITKLAIFYSYFFLLTKMVRSHIICEVHQLN